MIYPLLGSSYFNWDFFGSEKSFPAFVNAKKVVKRNNLQKKIKIIKIGSGILSEISEKFEVSICNPPFFEIGKDRNDGYGGVQEELSTAGGELKFIKQYMVESYSKRKGVLWFTCLIGIKAHLEEILRFLSQNFPKSSVLTSVLYQGRTLRWVLAWKFHL